MAEWTVDIPDLGATDTFGRRLGEQLSTGHAVALIGPLGSGKTTLVRSVAAGSGVADLRQVNSPTFVIVNEYESAGPPPLRIHHIDAYRLRGAGDLEAIGFEEMCETGAVLIEWADRVEDVLPADRLIIRIEPRDADQRRLRLKATGTSSGRLLAELAGIT